MKSSSSHATNGKYEVVITDSDYPNAEVEEKVLRKIGANVHLHQCRTPEEVARIAEKADALINNLAPITAMVITHMRKARIIAKYSAGFDNVDLEAATRKGIFVSNLPGINKVEVAEHTLSLMLASIRRLPDALLIAKTSQWNLETLQPISRFKGLTVGIVGFGSIGREVAKRVTAFGVLVIACDPYVPLDVFKKLHVQKVDMEALLEKSDVVTLHVPLNDATYHLMGKKQILKMKGTAVLLNVSRGAVVDQKALFEALEHKQIKAAALDVLETEPPTPGDPILSLKNIMITPHMAWYSETSGLLERELAAEEVKRVLQGKIPRNLINTEILQTKAASRKHTQYHGQKKHLT